MTNELLESVFAVVRDVRPSSVEKLLDSMCDEGCGPDTVRSLALTLPQRDQREALGRLASAWSESSESPFQVLGAINAAAYAARTNTRAEICWSGPTSSLQGFRSTAEAYRELISGAKESALILSFAVTEVEQLRLSLEDSLRRGVEVRLILEDFNVFTQESWRYQFDALGPIVLAQASILVWPTSKRRQVEGRFFGSMHVKCLAVDGHSMLMTSANWSGVAMHDNMELGVVLRDAEAVNSLVQHFDDLVTNGILVPLAGQRSGLWPRSL